MNLYKGFSIRIVRNDQDIYILFPRIINFKRDEVFSILVDYKSNGYTSGITDILAGKYRFMITGTETENVAAVFYENDERYGECELKKAEVYDVPYKVNTTLEMSSASFGDADNEKFAECLQKGESLFSYTGWKVCRYMKDGGICYEIPDGELQEIIDRFSSDNRTEAFNIEGFLFSQKEKEKSKADRIPDIRADSTDQKEYVRYAGNAPDKKYILIADASWPALKIECSSVLEAQIRLVKHRESDRDIRHCGNLFLEDEYVGWIDEKGDFHDKALPEGKYSSLNGVLHENCESYPEYLEIDSVHYMRLSVLEYEIFCTQMDGNSRYESDYPDKDAALYYSVEEQYIYPAENVLKQRWTELDKDTFDLFFIRENAAVDFIFSEEILRIRAALQIRDICTLDDENHTWILMDGPEGGDKAFATMYHAFMCCRKIFGYDLYPEYRERFYEADIMRIAKIKDDISEMENTKQKDGNYHIQVSQMDAVLGLIRKAEELGGKKDHDEIIVSEFDEIITLKRYVEEIKINSTFMKGDIFENGELL